jgi:hypothetical protein
MKTSIMKALLCGGIVFIAGCAQLFGRTPVAEIQPTEIQDTTQDESPDNEALPTDAPNFVTEAASLTYDPEICSTMRTETFGEVVEGPDTAFWDVHPAYTAIYCDMNSGGEPRQGVIAIYPLEQYKQLLSSTAEQVDSLTRILADHPDLASMDELPFMPIPNAQQMFHIQNAYLTLLNANGIRYLTQHSQGFMAVANDTLYYTFQGISSDGNYLIAAQFPIGHSSLPAEGLVSNDDFQAFVDNFTEYLSSTTAGLNAQPLESFIPDITKLDTMIQSMIIKSAG